MNCTVSQCKEYYLRMLRRQKGKAVKEDLTAVLLAVGIRESRDH
jgi:hypothetical protein